MKEYGLACLERCREDIKEQLSAILGLMTSLFGQDFHESEDYYRNEFGLDEEEMEEDTKILCVLDFFNAGGCYFPVTGSFQVDSESEWVTKAFYCLYVVEERGDRRLKYYAFENDGMEYDEDESEPDHGYVECLTLQELDKLCNCVADYVKHMKQ